MKPLLAIPIILTSVVLAAGESFNEAERYLKNREYDKAAKIYEVLAAAGNAEAKYMIGIFYDNGIYYQEDNKKAIRIFESLCGEYVEPCTRLGAIYVIQGQYDRAVAEYLKAAKSGDLRAYGDLGILYGNLKWKNRDPVEAQRWYDKLDSADREAYDRKERLTRHIKFKSKNSDF